MYILINTMRIHEGKVTFHPPSYLGRRRIRKFERPRHVLLLLCSSFDNFGIFNLKRPCGSTESSVRGQITDRISSFFRENESKFLFFSFFYRVSCYNFFSDMKKYKKKRKKIIKRKLFHLEFVRMNVYKDKRKDPFPE